MNVIVLGDVHWDIRNSSEYMQDYIAEWFNKVLFPYMTENNISHIIQLGDWQDRRKHVNMLTLHKMKKVLDNMSSFGFSMDIIEGNHDVYYKGTNEIGSPDLLLREYENISVYSEPTFTTFGLYLPWITSDNSDKSFRLLEQAADKNVFGHLELKGFDMYRGHTSDHGEEASMFAHCKKVFSGHYHTRSIKGNIEYIGTPYQLTWSDYGDPRGFVVLDTKTNKHEFIRNDKSLDLFQKIIYNETLEMKPIDEQFYANKFIKVIVEDKKDFKKFDRWIQPLYNIETFDLKIVESSMSVSEENVSDKKVSIEDTETTIVNYVDELEVDLDKDRLKNIMRSLYAEAQLLV